MLTFLTGPVRSGKSRFAESIAQASQRRVTYVATAQHDANDAEWVRRIERHCADRPGHWRTFETAGTSFAELERFFAAAESDELLLIDSLGTWLADRFAAYGSVEEFPEAEDRLDEECERFAGILARMRADIVVVSEETGWGIVPEYPSGRVFRDVLGRFNQAVAACADRAYLIVCGRALELHTAHNLGATHDRAR